MLVTSSLFQPTEVKGKMKGNINITTIRCRKKNTTESFFFLFKIAAQRRVPHGKKPRIYEINKTVLPRVQNLSSPNKSRRTRDDPINMHRIANIFGIMGACRRHELHQMKVNNVKDIGKTLTGITSGNRCGTYSHYGVAQHAPAHRQHCLTSCICIRGNYLPINRAFTQINCYEVSVLLPS
ncbi:hypothetical protein C0J52_27242 [Blattella germanica]|nr:hypothetical protein C0J52_27242 [Blattella germanica]